ncbi:MFS transporter [Longispora sp. NPDC051575]|uniref:MFS transporter n=1 Tax=Longispora sp. NPDC051575 TaxID=3154943 RepID=UPI00343ECE98
MTAVLQAPVVATRRWLSLFAILAATLMNLLDASVVSVAAPAIQGDLGGGYTAIQWIAASYTLAIAVGLLAGGRLGDLYGRKPMMRWGIVGFLVASVACAVAPSAEALIGARALQGLAAAVMIPQGFGLLRDLFGAALGKAFMIFGPAIGLSTVLGPVVAGALVDADVFGTGWRMIFLINLPLGAFALIAGGRALPDPAPVARGHRLDWRGAAVAGTGMFLLTFPLVQGRELDWPLWTVAMLVAAVPVLGLFARQQMRATDTKLIELSVFAKRSYTSGVAFVLVFFGAICGFALTVGMLLQLGVGQSATRASLTMAGWAVGAFVGSGLSGGLVARLGRTVLHLGLAVMAVGIGWLYLAFHGGSTAIVAPLAVFGLGMGMIFVPLFDIIMGDVADHETGSAAAALETVQQLAASVGVAVFGTVFFGRFTAPGTHFAAIEPVTLLALALTGLAFALGFLLPKRARQH